MLTESKPTRCLGVGVYSEHQSCFNTLWPSQYGSDPIMIAQWIGWVSKGPTNTVNTTPPWTDEVENEMVGASQQDDCTYLVSGIQQ